MNIDLRDTEHYRNITTLVSGTGNGTLIGGTGSETLVAAGTTSLWGGAGRDVLVSANGQRTDFFFMNGDGSDVVTDFTAGTEDTSDRLHIYDLAGVKMTSDGLVMTTTNGDRMTVKGSGVNANSKIKWTNGSYEGVAKIGRTDQANNFTFEDGVTNYIGGGKGDTLSLASGNTGSHNIWMDGSEGVSYSGIKYVDVSNATGDMVVAGNSESQSIVGGKGAGMLWSGAGSASDTLKSSAGSTTMFYWGIGEGNDLIISEGAIDVVNLYNVKLADLKLSDTTITDDGVTTALNDGNILTVQTKRNITFVMDGMRWTADIKEKKW